MHEATLIERQAIAEEGLSEASKPKSRKVTPEAQKLRELEKELLRKDKALAELTALVVLQK